MPTPRDFYEVLGVSKTATAAEIKSAYRKLALKFHPDRNKEKDAENKFKEINQAYQILSDEGKRKQYDQFGHAAFDPAGGMGGNPFAGGFRSGPFTYSYSTSGDFGNTDFGDPFEIFEQFFGGGGFTQRRPRYSIRISFLESLEGVTKKITIEGKERTVTIPAGVDDGTRIRFEDFDLSVDVASDARFKREGTDLYIEQEISFSLAALGGEIQVATPKSKLKLKVRPGTQSHTLVRLRGEGVPFIRRAGKGDLYVRLVISVPETMTREQKRTVELLRDRGL